MNIYLVRHAEAADKADDLERNLTEQGRRDAYALADALRPLQIRVDAIWHSGKPRALQTAEAIATAVACEGVQVVERAGLNPMAPVKRIARALHELGRNIMIVGHEPFLGRLASRLLTGHASIPLLSLSKPSVVCLHCDERSDAWRIAWMLSADFLQTTTTTNALQKIQSEVSELA